MNTFTLNYLRRAGLAAGTALLLNACAPTQDTPAPLTGLNASHYLAVGDSYTAGLSAGGLTRASQEYSFPNLLAKQLEAASSGGSFVQPLLEPGTGSGYLNLVDFTATGLPHTQRVAGQAVRRTIINPSTCGGPDTVRLLTRSSTSSTLPQNLGIPGLMLTQIETPGLGNEQSAVAHTAFNPYFERLLPASDSRTYLQAVSAAAPSATFFSFFMGLDDLMPFVRSGGTCGSFPSPTQMKQNAKKLLDVLTAGKRPGIIVKLPAITTLPLLRQGKGTDVEARLQAYYNDKALIYIETPFVPGASQHITDRDYILATALPRVGQLTPVQVGTSTLMLPYGRDSRNPIRDADVLENTSEMVYITSTINDYNNTVFLNASTVLGLAGLAKAYGLPIIDPAQNSSTLDAGFLFNNVANSISVGGVVYSAEPVRGNFFSLDNYSLTPRGNGLLANEFISAINKAYKANIPAIDVNSLPTAAR